MSETKEPQVKYFWCNTAVAILAIISSSTVAVYSVKKQNDYWKEQNAIKAKQKLNEIKTNKIENLIAAHNQFVLSQFSALKFTSYYLEAFRKTKPEQVKNTMEVLEPYTKLLIDDRDRTAAARIKYIAQLETLNSLFSEDVVNDAKILATDIKKGYFESEESNDIDMKEILESINFRTELLNVLINKMYLEVKSEI